MDEWLAAQDLCRRSSGSVNRGIMGPPFGVLGRKTSCCSRVEALAVIGVKLAKYRSAQARGFFQHGRENWGEVARRGIDDL